VADHRGILSALTVLLWAAALWSADRWAGETITAFVVVGATLAGLFALVSLLGRERGTVVGLLAAAALNRYTAEVGVSLKPEHLAALAVAGLFLPEARRLARRIDLVSGLLLAWYGWSLIGGLLNAPDPADSTRLWVMLGLVSFPFYLFVTALDSQARLRFAVDSWLMIGVAVGIFGLLSHLLFGWGIDLGIQVNPVTLDPTIPSTFREANLFGSAMMLLGLTGLGLIVFGAPTGRLVWLAAVVGVLGVQVSFTRTAWLAFLIGLVLLVVLKALSLRSQPASPVAWRSAATVTAAVVLGTLVIWAPIGDPDISQARDETAAEQATRAAEWEATKTAAVTASATVETMPVLAEGTPTPWVVPTPEPRNPDVVGRVRSIGDGSDSSIRIRIEFAKQALRDWRDHPLAGQGIGSFGQKYTTTSFDRAWLSNVQVRLLHDGGIVGLLLFVLPIALLAWRALSIVWNGVTTGPAQLTAALGVAVATMFVAFQATEGLQIAWYWCSLGLFAAAVRLAREPDGA
jgi:O-antigen ligase